MKPRHLKNQTLNQFGIIVSNASNSNQKEKKSSPDQKKKKIVDQNKLNLYSQYSSLIPFHRTKEYDEFLEWINNWKQSQPACILFGPIASGKTRIIQEAASKLLCHIIEIDCASIPGTKDLLTTFQESTKSRSVGIFLNHDNTNYDDAISMVVLEHIDSIISFHNPPSRPIIQLLSKSLVPLVMTSQSLCIQPASWIKTISVPCLNDPFTILKSADWLKNSINEISTNQAIHSLLSFTDQDVRQTSMQYQVWKNNSNSILSRDRQIYLSIPLCVEQRSDPKDRRDFYANICDLYISVNHDDQIFDEYIRPISEDFRSNHREQLFKDYMSFAKSRIRHENDSIIDNIELTEIVYQACVNDQPYTRNTTRVSLPPCHEIKVNEIQYVKSWNLWPYAGRDLPKDEVIKIQTENQSTDELKLQNETNIKKETETKYQLKTENESDVKNEIEKNEEQAVESVPEPVEEKPVKSKRGRKKKTDLKQQTLK